MTFEEYEEKHLHDLNHEARRLVRMGWNARGKHGADTDDGTKKATDSAPIVWIDPEDIKRTMIAVPGERAEVAAFKEGRFTAPLYENGAPDHIADDRKMVQGNVQAMGDLCFNEEDNYTSALVIEFASREGLRSALESGQCRFTVFGGKL